MRQRFTRMFTGLFTAAILATVGGPASATVLFSDSFDRADSDTVGANDNALGGTIVQTWNEAAQEADDETISSNTLTLASGDASGPPPPGTAWVATDHNFNTSDITDAGGFILSYKVNPVIGGDGTTNRWGGISIGHSGDSSKDTSGDGEFVILNSSGAFGLLIGDDATYAVFDNGSNFAGSRGSLGINPTGDELYNVDLTVLSSSFAVGASASASVLVNGSPIDLDVSTPGDQFVYDFTWNTGSNFLNFDTNDEDNGTIFDDVSVRLLPPVPEPLSAALVGFGGLALLGRRRRRA